MSKLRTLMKLAPFAVAALTAVKTNQMRDRNRRTSSFDPAGTRYDDTIGQDRDARSGTASRVLRRVADMLDKGGRR